MKRFNEIHRELRTIDGITYLIQHIHDVDHEPPWDNSDDRGIVSDWTTRPKRPGERILCEDRQSRRYFDWTATLAKAKAEGWGSLLAPETATPKQKLEAAVEEEFRRLIAWCDDTWYYIGIEVQAQDASRHTYYADVWGIESDDDTFIEETTTDLIADVQAQMAQYHTCPTCNGDGRVKAEKEPQS